MDRDRSWMYGSRVTEEYKNGIEKFLDFEFRRVARGKEITCPCKKCCALLWRKRNEVYEHLIVNGFMPNYSRWVHHGEREASTPRTFVDEIYGQRMDGDEHDDMHGMLHAVFGSSQVSPNTSDANTPASKRTRVECDEMASNVDKAEDAALWTPQAEELFIKIMADEVNKGNMPTSTFQMKSWQFIDDEMFKQIGRRFTLPKLKGKFSGLQKHYCEFAKLLEHTRFGWNPDTNTVTADEDTWQKYVKANPYAQRFRKKGCEHYNLLGLIYNKLTTTGLLHRSSAQAPPTSDEERELEDAASGVYQLSGLQDQPDVVTETTRDDHKCRSSSASMDRRARKGRMRYKGTSSIADHYSLEACMDVLEGLKGLENKAYFAGCQMFLNPDWRNMFLKMSTERKRQWLASLD